MNHEEIVISGFDYTGKMVEPWAEAGYLCYCIDIQHSSGACRKGNIIFVGADIKNWLPPRKKVIFSSFFPPCTHLSVSGARWFKGKGLRRLSESIELFARAAELAEWLEAPYIIENPVSTISSYWRKADYFFDPSDYADYLSDSTEEAYTKKTCLWTGNGFIMPDKKAVEPILGSKMHLLPPSKVRANLRSSTPSGFARAVFEANCLKSIVKPFFQKYNQLAA